MAQNVGRLIGEMKQLRAAAEAAGWRVERSGGNHLKWIPPTGGAVFTSATPSDRRAAANMRRDLRRYGLDV